MGGTTIRPSVAPRPSTRDLFGEVPVTLDEVSAWVLAVAGISPASWRFAWYVANWRVVEKIRAAKLAGTFDQAVAARPDTLALAVNEAADELRAQLRRRLGR